MYKYQANISFFLLLLIQIMKTDTYSNITYKTFSVSNIDSSYKIILLH